MSVSINPLVIPGVAALTFKHLQRGSRYGDVLTNLRAVKIVHSLPGVAWSVDSTHGVVGTIRGGDDEIVTAVWAWADAFAVKAAVESAYLRFGRPGGSTAPGFAVVHLFAGVTVGGRLVEPEAGR